MLATATRPINISITAYIRANQHSLGAYKFAYNNGLQLWASKYEIFQYVTENIQIAKKYVSALIDVKIAKRVSFQGDTYEAS